MTPDLPGETGGDGEPPLTGDDAPPWWEDDRDWGDEDEWGEFPRRRRSRVLQVTGVVVAAALVLGSVGGVVGVLLDDHSSVVLPTRDVAVAPGEGGSHVVRITFQIENPTGATVKPVCVVTVAYDGRDLVGPGQVQLAGLAAHSRETLGFKIRTASIPPPGSRATVACQT